MKFSDLKLINPLLKALEKVSFDTPTEVQEKVIPLALE
jgi:superfamily II DNA/RNA helicase